MKQDIIKDLTENTFAKLACPAAGNGMYSEIQRAILEAYNIGKAHQQLKGNFTSNEFQSNFIRA